MEIIGRTILLNRRKHLLRSLFLDPSKQRWIAPAKSFIAGVFVLGTWVDERHDEFFSPMIPK